MAILFFIEDVNFEIKEKNLYKKWLRTIAERENYIVRDLNYIFCSDEYLYEINKTYLKHKTYTDIITFDQSEQKQDIEGDIYISIDRVKENALKNNDLFDHELNRVMAHGLLHLMGYKDKKSEEVQLMRSKEEESIALFSEMFHVKHQKK